MEMQKKALHDYIQNHAIPVPLPTIKAEDGKLYGVGMDGMPVTANSANGIPQSIFSIGNQLINPNIFAWYTSQGFIGYQACSILQQNWLVNKACEQRGKDAVSKWFSMSVNDGEDVDKEILAYITKRNLNMKLKLNLTRAHKFNNVFGVRHVLFVVESDDKDYYQNPFNPDSIKEGSYKGISQIDPYWIAQNLTGEGVSDPTSIDFYEPEHWVVAGKKIHRSHFTILRGAEVSDFLKPSYLYGGLSLVQRIYERVYAAERTANEAPQLARRRTRRTSRELSLRMTRRRSPKRSCETSRSGVCQLMF